VDVVSLAQKVDYSCGGKNVFAAVATGLTSEAR
jgi:hypothetical protein